MWRAVQSGAVSFLQEVIGNNIQDIEANATRKEGKQKTEDRETLPVHSDGSGLTEKNSSKWSGPNLLKMTSLSSSSSGTTTDTGKKPHESNPADMEAGHFKEPETLTTQPLTQVVQEPMTIIMSPPYPYTEYEQQFNYGLFRTALVIEQGHKGYLTMDQLESMFVLHRDPIFQETGSYNVIRTSLLDDNYQMKRNTICCPCEIALDPDTNRPTEIMPLGLGELMTNNIDIGTSTHQVNTELDATLRIEGKMGWLLDFRMAIASTENCTLECRLNLEDSEWITLPSTLIVNEKIRPQSPSRPSSPVSPPPKQKKRNKSTSEVTSPVSSSDNSSISTSAGSTSSGKEEVDPVVTKDTSSTSFSTDFTSTSFDVIKTAAQSRVPTISSALAAPVPVLMAKTYMDMENEPQIVEHLTNDANSRSLVRKQYTAENKFTLTRSKIWAMFVAGRDVDYFKTLEVRTEKLTQQGFLIVRRTIESQVLLTGFADNSSFGSWMLNDEFVRHVAATRSALENAGEDAFRIPPKTWNYVLAQCEPFMRTTMLEKLQIQVRRHDLSEWSCRNPTIFVSFTFTYRVIDQGPLDIVKFDYRPIPLPSSPLPESLQIEIKSLSGATPTADSTVKTV